MDKKVHLFEPYGGFVTQTEINFPYKFMDTGLCNRLYYWNDVYHNTKNTDYKIYVEKIWWPELDIISLPNTIRNDYGFSLENYSYEKENFIVNNNLTPLNSPYDKLTHDEYFSNYNYNPIRNTFPVIKFKNAQLETFIKNFCKELVGIHIRRGNGVSLPVLNMEYKDKSLNIGTVKKYDLDIIDYKTTYELTGTEAPYIPNEYYIKIIESLIKIDSKKKFYISSDIPDEYISEILNTFKNNIYTYSDLVNNQLKEFDTKKYEWPYENTFKNVFDLFCLSRCKILIDFPMSSWSDFARDYGRIKNIHQLI